jgi:hypothetical protein
MYGSAVEVPDISCSIVPEYSLRRTVSAQSGHAKGYVL